MSADYEIRIAGSVDDATALALCDLDVTVVADGTTTIVRGRLDQPGLHGLLERIHMLGLPLDELRRVRVWRFRR